MERRRSDPPRDPVVDRVEFALVPIDRLKLHEETEPARVEEVRADIEGAGLVREPILVARGSWVVLNGHHRLAALRALGAHLVPVFLVDYADEAIELDRWGSGPKLSKSDVLARAESGSVYPPKTTKHTVRLPLPERTTPLARLKRSGRRARS